MKALERIKEIAFLVKPIHEQSIISREMWGWEIKFLLKAFKIMREVALQKTFNAQDSLDSVDADFEEKMAEK